MDLHHPPISDETVNPLPSPTGLGSDPGEKQRTLVAVEDENPLSKTNAMDVEVAGTDSSLKQTSIPPYQAPLAAPTNRTEASSIRGSVDEATGPSSTDSIQTDLVQVQEPISLQMGLNGTPQSQQKRDLPASQSTPQGAWTKPLVTSSSSTTVLHSTMTSLLSDLQANTCWPSLAEGNQIRGKRAQQQSLSLSKVKTDCPQNHLSKGIHRTSEEMEAHNRRFPWAAKLSPNIRNLHRTANPTFMEDGTPLVDIPNHVLLQGLENQKKYVIGQFTKCSMPSGGLVNGVTNRLWGRKCNIYSRKLGEFSYIFHIPDNATRNWVLSRGVWHVDECIMFVAPWTPSASLELPEITTFPVWVKLKNIPCSLYSIPGVELIASGVGEPMLSDKPRLDPTHMGEAKVLVELELHKKFPQKVAARDKKGNISMVSVDYAWIPENCENCGLLGHKSKRCLEPIRQAASAMTNQKYVDGPPIQEQNTPAIVHEQCASVSNQESVAVSCTQGASAEGASIVDHHPPESGSPKHVKTKSAPKTTHSEDGDAVKEAAPETTQVLVNIGNTENHNDNVVTVENVSASSSPTKLTTDLATQELTSPCFAPTNDVSQLACTELQLPHTLPHVEGEILTSPSLGTLTEDSKKLSDIVASLGAFPQVNLSQILPNDPLIREHDIERSESLGTHSKSRGGRPIKPTQKIQEMEWLEVGKGNRGRRGRGRGFN